MSVIRLWLFAYSTSNASPAGLAMTLGTVTVTCKPIGVLTYWFPNRIEADLKTRVVSPIVA